MAAKVLSRLFAPLLMLTAACQMAPGDDPGTSEAFSTDSPVDDTADDTADELAPPSTPDLFAWQCQGIADEVAYCASELPLWEPDADVATACAPEDPAIGLACCNAFGGDHCALACEAGTVAGAGDLAALESYLGEGGLASASSRVIATCGGDTFDDVLASESAAASELLATYGVDGWGEGEARPADEIGGIYLVDFSEARRMLDEIGHDDELVAWSFDRQVGTEEGEFFLTKWLFFYPQTGVVVVLEGAVGFI